MIDGRNGLIGLILLVLVSLNSVGCFGLAEDRARLDLEVGNASAGGVDVRVKNGLAAVHSMIPGELVLWSQAPVLRIGLQVSDNAVEDWTVLVKNVRADSRLTASPSSEPVEITPMEWGEVSTRKKWSLRLTPGTESVLRLAPDDAESFEPWRFGVVNDPHGAERIASLVEVLNEDEELSMILSAGDISGGGGSRLLNDVQDALKDLRIPFYSTAGNSDVSNDPVYAWHETFGRYSFNFDYRNVKFSFVDSASASVAPMVYDWLDGWLNDSKKDTHFFFTHIPPLDPFGSRSAGFRSRNEAAKILNKLAGGKTDLIVCGHLHSYYDYEMAKIPTVVTGPLGHEEGTIRRYLVVDVDPETGAFATSRVW